MSSNTDDLQAARQHVAATDPVDARDLHLLVYSYLLHTNCARTASAFARTSGLATSGSLTSASAPAYLSSPFNHSMPDAHTDDLFSAAAAKKGKGCVRMDDDDIIAPSPPPAVDLSEHSNSATNSGYSSCVSISEAAAAAALPPLPRRAAVTHATDVASALRARELIEHHIEYLRIRQSICASIEAREPQVALDLLSTYFRSVLIPPPAEQPTMNPRPLRREFDATLLRFRLDIQHYVELIATHKELDALQFGQRTLWRYTDIFDAWLNNTITLPSSTAGESLRRHYLAQPPEQPPLSQEPADNDEVVSRVELKQKRAEIMRHITNVAALVAYPDPTQSPLAYLLAQERREELAAAVNAAILQSMSFPREPALVALVRQLATTSAYLVGYRSSSSSRTAAAVKKDTQQQQQQQQPWVLDTFVNSDADTFA
ncbi:hypothetical protein FBU31_006738 [Coemansia sp. 'formosensis']|nr:hypothetical protein FBU31_006738 [Coemansia sp. 'formosensis']